MSADVINLRQARKQRERVARRKRADENRVKHGRTKAERTRIEQERNAETRQLDGHWLGQSAPPGEGVDGVDLVDKQPDAERDKS